MILEQIVKNKQLEIAALAEIALDKLVKSKNDFSAAFMPHHCGIIAELKSQSPSQGIICKDYHPEKIAEEYVRGGANAISVLTDKKFFGGDFEHLKRVRAVTQLPLLCKDFIIHEKQINHARAAGADACLLIMSILNDTEVAALKQHIEVWGMTALLEVHNETELQRAIKTQPKLIGINNRNLKDFSINMQHSASLCANIPAGIKVISESGIAKPEDILNLPPRINGVLIGTALMKSQDRPGFLRALRHEN